MAFGIKEYKKNSFHPQKIIDPPMAFYHFCPVGRQYLVQ